MQAPVVRLSAEFRVIRASREGVRSQPGARPTLRGVAPAFVLQLRGPADAAARAASELWGAAQPGPPQAPLAAELAGRHGLETRVWQDAVCVVRPSGRGGSWDFVVSAPGPVAGVPGPEWPADRLRFRAGDTALTAVRNLWPHADWLFLVIRVNGNDLGALAVGRVEIPGGVALRAALRSKLAGAAGWCRELLDGLRPARPGTLPAVLQPEVPPVGPTRVRISVESLSAPLGDRRQVEAALQDPAVTDVAPVMDVTFGDRDGETVAQALWERAAGPDPARAAPAPWVRHFLQRGLAVRAAEHCVLWLRHEGPTGVTDAWLSAGAPPQPGAGAHDAWIGLRLDAASGGSMETAMTRSGWLFVILRTASQPLGILAVRHAHVLRGPAAGA